MGSAERQAAWSSLILLEGLRGGNEPAATAVFLRYFARLRALARSRLSPRLARRADPEDILMSAYRSFFIGARSGRFSLAQRGDLWRLLSGILKHKLFRRIRYETAERRSIDREMPAGRIAAGQIRERKPLVSAEDAALWTDELGWISSQLDPTARQVLRLRLQGAQLSEIAQLTRRSERTVRRTLREIRDLMEKRRIDPCPWLSHEDFLLQRMIGAGRMGKVYQAWQHSAGRPMAVKYLRRTLLHQRDLVARFIDESRIVTALRHPHIVGVHGLGRTPGGSYFIVMDFVDGPNLADLGNRREITITRTDVYGVGAVLFTLLTGRPPWPGRTLESILADVTSSALVISPALLRCDVPESLSEVCRKCLCKSPADRYRTLQDVRSALAGASGT